MKRKTGQIVTVDWRKEPDPPPRIPNHLSPTSPHGAGGADDSDPALAIPDLTVVLQPRISNGCKKVSYLLPQNLTCIAKTRITATKWQITPTELQQLRQLVVSANLRRLCAGASR